MNTPVNPVSLDILALDIGFENVSCAAIDVLGNQEERGTVLKSWRMGLYFAFFAE